SARRYGPVKVTARFCKMGILQEACQRRGQGDKETDGGSVFGGRNLVGHAVKRFDRVDEPLAVVGGQILTANLQMLPGPGGFKGAGRRVTNEQARFFVVLRKFGFEPIDDLANRQVDEAIYFFAPD